ncbi:MAG: hypothetical protein AAF458_02240 [Pseudomonadota bacterium]
MRTNTNRTPIEQADASRKAAERGLLLPFIGMLLLLPPVAGIFQLDVRLFGVPLAALYLFTVWAVLIVLARVLAKPLLRGADAPPGAPGD